MGPLKVWKFLVLIGFLALGARPAAGINLITAVIRPTNGTTSGNGVTINGILHYGTNVLGNATWVTNASPAQSTTNLFSNLSLFPLGGGLSLGFTNTNSITIQGSTLAVSITAGWATLNLYTNLSTNWHAVMTPVDVSPLTVRTTDMSDLVYGESTYSSNSFLPGSTAMKHFADLTTSQTLSNKTLKLAALSDGSVITNTRVQSMFLELSNHIDFSNAMSFPTLFGGLRFYGDPPTKYTLLAPAVEDPWITYQVVSNGTVYGFADISGFYPFESPNLLNAGSAMKMFPILDATIFPPSTQVTNHWLSTNDFGGGINGTNAHFTKLNADAVVLSNAFAQSFIASNCTILNAYGSTFSNTFSQSLIASNAIYAGTNQWIGDLAFPWYELTTLGATNNYAIPIGTNRNVIVSGPTAAFTISGIVGGRKGRELTILNGSGWPMTLSQTTVDPTPENRIVCRVTGDITFDDGDWVDLKWDHRVSKWRIKVATAYNTNDVSSGLNRTNFSVWPSTTANNPLTINGLSGQTAELSLWVSNGTPVAKMHAGGNLTVNSLTNNGSSTQTGSANIGGNVIFSNNLVVAGSVNFSNLTVTASNTTSVPLAVKLAAAATTNAMEIKDATGNTLFGVRTNGLPFLGSSNTFYPISFRAFKQTNNSTVTNISTAETSWFSTSGDGSRMFTNNFLKPGYTVRGSVRGSYWTPATPGNTAIYIKLGSTVIATNIAQNLTALTGSEDKFRLNWEFTVLPDNTVSANGAWEASSAPGGANMGVKWFRSAAATIDPTAALLLDVTSTNGTTTTSFKIEQGIVEIVP